MAFCDWSDVMNSFTNQRLWVCPDNQWRPGRGGAGGGGGGGGGAPTHLPLYDVGRHGHQRAPGVRRSLNFTFTVLSSASAQSSDLMVIDLFLS